MQDGQVVSVAGPAVAAGEGMRQDLQPLAGQPVDTSRVESVADALQAGRVVTRSEPVVEGFEGDAGLGGLTFGPLVTVDAQLGVVREVGAELEEERTEVGIDGVNVEVVDHGRGLDDPRVAGPADRVVTLLGAEHGGLLLSPADEQHPLGAVELGQKGLSQIVFALILDEVDDRDVPVGRER